MENTQVTKRSICYISDNRTGLNWGAKATSIALHSILSEKYSINSTIFNNYKTKDYYLGYLFFEKYHFIAPHKKFNFRIWELFILYLIRISLRLKIARSIDLRSKEIEKNISFFLKFKSKFKDLIYLDDCIKNCDEIVINGEGDMILSGERKTLNFLLTLIGIGHFYGKKLHFINAMISPCPINGIDESTLNQCIIALQKCRTIQFRESESIEFLREKAPNINASLVPDALFTWESKINKLPTNLLFDGDIFLPHTYEKLYGTFDFQKPYICISGSSIAPRINKIDIINSYKELIFTLKNEFIGYTIFLIIPCSGDKFLIEVGSLTQTQVIPIETNIVIGTKILANARLYISGRYHPSIMASLGGCPIISFNSNSHKMIGLQKLLEYKTITHFSLPLNNQDISTVLETAKKFMQNNDVRTQIHQTVKKLSDDTTENTTLL
jgi:polysaccharide pyruvyl transferase WcaK-like protein